MPTGRRCSMTIWPIVSSSYRGNLYSVFGTTRMPASSFRSHCVCVCVCICEFVCTYSTGDLGSGNRYICTRARKHTHTRIHTHARAHTYRCRRCFDSLRSTSWRGCTQKLTQTSEVKLALLTAVFPQSIDVAFQLNARSPSSINDPSSLSHTHTHERSPSQRNHCVVQ
jgi:hypothetical protein